jgi:hypothetical protein
MPKLTSPFPPLNEDNAEWLHAKIPREMFTDLFCRLLVGDRGPRQILIQHFFSKFYDECKRAFNSDFTYDPTKLPTVIAIVERLNFNAPQQLSGAGERPSPRPERPVRTRRTNKSASVPPKQPTIGNSVRGGVAGAGETT